MQAIERKITFYTPDKIYSGVVDVKEKEIRMIDLLNSANIYWKNPNEMSFSDAILLNRASIRLTGGQKIGGFTKLQMRLTDIIFFTDQLEKIGNTPERLRQNTLAVKMRESATTTKILTKTRGDSFYIITGTFAGLFKSKSRHRYLPITDAKVIAVLKRGEKWSSKTVLENQFIGMFTEHIESCSFN